jgi:curved DNA-binding protein CbpA
VAAIDLYEVLGAERSADRAALRAAFRKKAKRAHPDGGGSEKQFAVLKLAHDVLTDERRRRSYDKTGAFDEVKPDNAETEAMQMTLQAIFAVMENIEKNGLRVENFDLVGDTISHLNKLRGDWATEIARLKASGAEIRKLAKRFRARKGKVNRLAALLDAQAVDRERAVADGERKRETALRAISILKDHEFDVDRVPIQQHMNRMMAGMFIRSSTT